MKNILGLLMLSSVILAGCAVQPLSAPCDAHAVLCGEKHRINV